MPDNIMSLCQWCTHVKVNYNLQLATSVSSEKYCINSDSLCQTQFYDLIMVTYIESEKSVVLTGNVWNSYSTPSGNDFGASAVSWTRVWGRGRP